MTNEAATKPVANDVRRPRGDVPPIWTGDLLDGQLIVGFALRRDPGPIDQVLVEGDEKLPEPAHRPLPCPGDLPERLSRSGPPPDGAPAAGLSLGMTLGVSAGLDRQLHAMGEAGDYTRRVLDQIDAEGHRAWLVGGAVRDLIAPGPAARPADLDFTGTIGPGELYDATRRWRRAAGMGDYRSFISRWLVFAVAPPGGNRPDAFIEYKPLSQPGFRFPAWGGTLAADAATRDLTINALYYDRANRVVADPTGRGVRDLLAPRRTAATPYRGDDPAEQACVILRCLKFRLRWPDLDVAGVAAWAAGLPADLISRVPEDRFRFLDGLRCRCVPQRHRGVDERAAAREIGPAALRLVDELLARERAGA
jgi:hypothetical protein